MTHGSGASRSHAREHGIGTLAIGVFLLFAPFGFMLSLLNGWAPGSGIATAAFSGAIAIGWMYTFQSRRYWLILPMLVLPTPPISSYLVFIPLARTGVMDIGHSLDPFTQRLIHTSLAVACTALGFTLVVRFIRRTETITSRWKAELDLGQRIHQRLVTPIALRTPRLEIVGQSDASAEMGGDLLDLLCINGRIDLLVGDVSGHGVAAGVVMATVRGAVRSRLHAESPGSLSDLLRDLSRTVSESNAPEMFATMAAVRLRENSNTVEVALAGHNPVLWWRNGPAVLEDIENESLPLGVMADETFPVRTITPAPGDWLIAYTDGLVEVFNAEEHQLGMRGLREILDREITHCPHPEDLIRRVIDRVRAYGPISDDQTIAALRFLA